MHTKSDNVEIIIGSETNEILDDIFKFLLKNYQKDLEESMRGSE